MNANEVIANRALELMGFERGQYEHCDPHDHVNCSRSTNHSYPTALHVAIVLSNARLTLAMLVMKPRRRAPATGATGAELRSRLAGFDLQDGLARLRGDHRVYLRLLRKLTTDDSDVAPRKRARSGPAPCA